MDPAPLSHRLLLSFGVATFIAALASVLVLADVRRRVERLEVDRSAPAERGDGQKALAPRTPREPGTFPPPKEEPKDGDVDPLESRDPLVKLDHLIKALQEVSDNAYDASSDMMGDLVAIKREIRQLKATVRNLGQAVQQGRPGGLTLGWGLAPRGQPIGGEVAKAWVEEARRFGMEIEPGRVTARALLNMSPRKDMPIEYFITRFPESGHETLVHLIGAGELPTGEQREGAPNPLRDLRGLGTALYKALRVAGFKEGEGSHVDEPAPRGEERPDPQAPPKLVLPTGDVVYLYVRYVLDGATHVARATDWVLDPSTGKVLPEDCFRFTGSLRARDPETDEEMLAAELGGLFVSVWPNATALLEVALDSSIHNDYQYNSARIPRPAARADGTPPDALLLDLIFSAKPLPTEGEGAK
jgi:hypothetical protein